jgi:hypothetical protein
MYRLLLVVFLVFASIPPLEAQVLNKKRMLESQTYLDNRDWEWYSDNIPFFECPDEDITKTYYYRWELLTKHLTYGSPTTGYVFTEFIDRPFWSGAYGAISCPAGHQLYVHREVFGMKSVFRRLPVLSSELFLKTRGKPEAV